MDANILTLHVPLTKGGAYPTFHLFDEARLTRLKGAPLLLNSSRGAVVETGALKKALADGRVRAAVLDVWEGEPAIDAGLLDRTLVGTAHVAGYSQEGKMNAVRMVRDALVRHFGLDAAGLSALDPGPADLPMISIADGEAPDEEIIRAAVSSAYDIAFDDGLLRDASARPSAERPAAFARLRSGYRVRREFSARTVGLPARRASAGAVLAALGFKVVFRP